MGDPAANRRYWEAQARGRRRAGLCRSRRCLSFNCWMLVSFLAAMLLTVLGAVAADGHPVGSMGARAGLIVAIVGGCIMGVIAFGTIVFGALFMRAWLLIHSSH